MIDKEKAALNPTKQWVKFIVVLVLYLLFLLWVESWWIEQRKYAGSGGKMLKDQSDL